MNDKELRGAVVAALDYEPGIDGPDIGVAVEGGVVTLTGHVKSYAQKLIAERVVSRVKGVRAIAMDVHIRYPSDLTLTDAEIGDRAARLLFWDILVPNDTVTVEVEKGWVKLVGQVRWQFQKDAAANAIKRLGGVLGVTNDITLQPPHVKVSDIKDRILSALKRSAEVDAHAIRVEVRDDTVVLEGKVKAWNEREVAERAAWAAPGVRMVDDRLSIG